MLNKDLNILNKIDAKYSSLWGLSVVGDEVMVCDSYGVPNIRHSGVYL